jgi:hypothetical protein
MASLATATAILVPVYAINSTQIIDRSLYPYGRNIVFGTAGMVVQPNAGDGSLNSLQAGRQAGAALIYSRVSVPATGDTVFFSSKTVAEIMTLAGFS